MSARGALASVFALVTATAVSPAIAQRNVEDGKVAATCTLSPREVVERFAEMFYLKKEVRAAFETWVHEDYIQHKPTLPNGREPVISFLEKLLAAHPERTFTIHRMIASDDLVAVHYHSQANPDDPVFAVVDIFRVEDCKMVEHWDVVQRVPEESANDNTMF